MAREIKFRAWDGKGFIYSNHGLGNFFGDTSPVCAYGDDYVADDIALMQYTGLTDREGKEVYESDILEMLVSGVHYGAKEIVEFKNGCFWLRYRDVSINEWLSNDVFGEYEIKVIGNIHENPDLLK
jgi:uncharacterized phage protein (TIGR01671 family)